MKTREFEKARIDKVFLQKITALKKVELAAQMFSGSKNLLNEVSQRSSHYVLCILQTN